MKITTTARNVLTVLLFFALVHCSLGADVASPDDPNPSTQPAVRSLASYADCDEMLVDFKARLINSMTERLAASYAYCDYDYEYDYEDGEAIEMTSDGATTTAASDDADSSEAGAEYTGTNLQESDVDEADSIKTDGEYVYVATGASVDVFKAWPLSDFAKVATLDFEDAVSGLFLSGDTLVAVQSASENFGSATRVSYVNVANPENPDITTESLLPGSLSGSRLVGGILHVVTNDSASYNLSYPARDCDDDFAQTEAEENLSAQIAALTLEEIMPFFAQGETDATLSCTDFVHDDEDSDTNLAILSSLDLEGSEIQATVIAGRSQEVYASTESVYFAARRSDEDASEIHRFTIGGENALHAYHASGAVSGHILDQFSISEYDDHLRVATTVGELWQSGNSEVYNNVYVLDSDSLAVTGAVERIAEGEAIYAARFIGQRGYVVTFEKVDPLFVLNLADPENPILEGELKIPGYSTYLHPIDENHLIGLGKDAEDAGGFSWYQGLKLAVFDVSDGTSPLSLDDLIIGSRGSESSALTDHHAFTFDNDSGILALPVSLYEGGSGGSDYGDYQYDGVHLYSISAEGGIATLALIETADDGNSVQRTLILGDDTERGLFVLDDENLSVFELGADYQLLDSEDLSGESNSCSYWCEE